MATKDELFEVLKGVIDPEVGINIVDLGLVYEAYLDEATDKNKIIMTLTTPGCPMHNNITLWVENIVKQFEPEKEVAVSLVWEPKWNPSMMSAEARRELNG